MRRETMLITACMFWIAPDAGALDPPKADTERFTYAHGLVFVDGRIGTRDVLCLVDTGASVSAIDTAVANELGLEALGVTEVLGSAGTESATIVKLDSLSLGSQTVENLQPTSRDIHHNATPRGERLDVIVGYDFLRGFATLVDFEKQDVRFATDAPARCKWIDMDLGDRIPRVAVTIDGAHETWLRIDTGASLFTTSDVYVNLTQSDLDALRKFDADLQPQGSLSASGVGGEIILSVFHLEELQIGGIRVARPRAIIQPKQGYFALPNAVGFLGNNLLEKHGPIALDYRRSRLGVHCRLEGS
jgi:predicted aspartyl protease